MPAGHDLRYTWRSLRRTPLFTTAVIVTLTIGIASVSSIFAVVNAVLIRPLPYANPDRLVGVWMDMPPLSLHHVQQSSGIYVTFRRYAHSLEDIALYQTTTTNAIDPDGVGNPQRLSVLHATSNTLPMLGVQPLIGRTFNAAEDRPDAPPVAVISEGLWRTRYASDQHVLGKTIVLGGKPTTIIGVMPTSFRFPSSDMAAWLPMQLDTVGPPRSGFSYNAVARLRPGATAAAAERELASVLPRLTEVQPTFASGLTSKQMLDQAKPIPRVTSMRDDVVGPISGTLWMVAAIAVLLLIVTAANVANLLLVRGDGRHRELAVRAALGAGRRRVLAYFFIESGFLAFVSVIVGVSLAAIAIRVLVHSGVAAIPRLDEVRIDAATIVFAVAIGAVLAALCSALPALRFARAEMVSGLRDGGRAGTIGARRQRARSALVAGQMALALVVMATSALLLRSFQHLRLVRPGFDAQGVATLWVGLPRQRYAGDSSVVRFYARLIDEASHVAGATGAAITSRVPLEDRGSDMDPVFVEDDAAQHDKIPQLSLFATVSDGYFATMRIPIIAGRTFSPMSESRGDEAILSQEAARQYFHDSTGRTAIGRRIQELPKAQWKTVVGVVAGVRDTMLSSPPTRTVYVPQALGGDTNFDHVTSTMALVVRTQSDVAQTSKALERIVHDLDPTLPTFDVRSMQAAVDASMAQLQFVMILIAVAAAVTLALSVVGLYAVIAYIVTLRTRELGVRIALGAQPSAVATMVTRQGLVLCGIGLVAGLAVVAGTTRFMRSFLFEVGPNDPLSIGAAAGVLVAFALVASWIPARRASRVDPVTALRAD